MLGPYRTKCSVTPLIRSPKLCYSSLAAEYFFCLREGWQPDLTGRSPPIKKVDVSSVGSPLHCFRLATGPSKEKRAHLCALRLGRLFGLLSLDFEFVSAGADVAGWPSYGCYGVGYGFAAFGWSFSFCFLAPRCDECYGAGSSCEYADCLPVVVLYTLLDNFWRRLSVCPIMVPMLFLGRPAVDGSGMLFPRMDGL